MHGELGAPFLVPLIPWDSMRFTYLVLGQPNYTATVPKIYEQTLQACF